MRSRLCYPALFAGLVAVLALAAPGGPAGAAAQRPATAAPYCGRAIAKPGGGTWQCTFDDEFNGTQLDRTKWVPITTAASGLDGGGACFVDSPANIGVWGGALHLTARDVSQPFTCTDPQGSYRTHFTSGQVASYGTFAQTYGRFSVRARFPASTVAGLQSSLWMWPQANMTNGLYGEIDIAEEYSSYADRAIPYLHYWYNPLTTNAADDVNVVTNNYCMIDNVNAYHVYTVVWTSGRITIDYDGQTCLVDNYQAFGASPFEQPFFVALTQSLGIGGNAYVAGRTQLPATTSIDWVRVWK